MAYDYRSPAFDLPAGADLSASQYRFVGLSGGRIVPDIFQYAAIGVLQNRPAAAGQPATVVYAGVSKIVLGGSVNADDRVMSDSTGAAVVPETDGGIVCAIVFEAGIAGDIVPAFVLPGALLGAPLP